MKVRIPVLFWVFLFFPRLLPGEDGRTEPVSIYLIFDGSSMAKSGLDGAVQWIGATVIDTMLREGDALSLWITGGGPGPVFSEVLSGAAGKDRIKELLRSAVPGEGRADYAGALREAAARVREGRGLSYTLLITGTAEGNPRGSPSRERDAAELLRYSRVLEFSGWRAQVVGLGITSRVQAAASAYMAGG
ncbi:MAG: hypothetical protein LBU28_01640 [Spirochaetaceae bacterium]|jgi:hypothetical protein|nr:hypothetical protein [Spirochaetaceae bacterium]